MKVELLDSMGNDLSVVNAARVSFHKEAEFFTDKDVGLIRYLARHKHWTPFAQVTYQVRIQAPIFIARQWFKHQIGITRNEVSRRYVDDEPQFFEPAVWRSRPEGSIKQGSGSAVPNTGELSDRVRSLHNIMKEEYYKLLSYGVAPEQARMILPQSMMTEWVETGSLAAAARIAKQRIDFNAQVEIQDLAKQFEDQIKQIAPVSWMALTEGVQ